MTDIAKLMQQVDAVLGANDGQPTAPQAPAHLDAVASAKWAEIVAEADGRIKVGDLDALELYVSAWARWREAEAKVGELGTVIKSPSGFPCQNPYLSIANKALEQLLKIGKRLGLADPRR